MPRAFTIRVCTADNCRLRIPVIGDDLPQGLCPRCASKMRIVESGVTGENRRIRWQKDLSEELCVLLDNVRSVFNVGAILRVAEGVGIRHAYLCGITPTPDHRKLAKTALGAETNVAWTYHSNALEVVKALATQGYGLWALETVPGAPSVFDSGLPTSGAGVVLIVGNEVTGIDPGVLANSNRVLHLPMHGSKASLNVAVTLGIAAYWLRGKAEVSARQSGANGTSAS